MKYIAVIASLLLAAPALTGDLWEAICLVESGNIATAYNPAEQAAGIAQIRPIVIECINDYLGYEKFTLDDRYCPKKSREIFLEYTWMWIVRKGWHTSDEVRARIWNGGPDGPRKHATLAYWERAQEQMRRLREGRR